MYPMIFSPFSRPGMNFSFSTYEMTNGSLQSSMNCLMNQAWADMGARRELYFYPQYSFNNFSQYQNVFSNNYLTDINYTLGQYHFNSLANGGQGLYGWNAVPTFNNNGNQWGCGWTPWGWQGSNGGSQAGSSSDKDNEFRADYESLKTLLETYRDKGNVGKSTKTKINEALGKSGSYEERLDALKSVYKKLDKNSIKKVIAFLPEYKTELENAGYKMSNTSVDIDAIHSEIEGIKSTDEEYTGAEKFANIAALATLDDGSANNILAIISKWNDTYKGNDSCIVGAVLAKTNDKNKNNNYQYFVTPLVSALKNKAEQVKDECDETTVKNIDKVISDLTKAVNDKNNTSVTTNFKKLYVMLRDVEAKRINRDLQDEYKFLNDIADDDTDIINGNLIIDATKTDLKSEELETDYNAIKDDIALSERDEIVDEGDDDDENDTTADKMESLVSNGTLITNGATDAGETIYEETTVAEGATKRQFIIKDEKVHVYNNGVIGEEVTPESIKAAKKAVDDANEAAAAQEAEEQQAIQDQRDIKVNGKNFAHALRNEKTSGKLTSANTILSKIDENNVMGFLDGVYSVKERPLNGYFERMDRRNNGTITMDNQKVLIKAVLDKAKKAGLQNSKNYENLEAIYSRYTGEGALAHEENFNHRNKQERRWGNWKDKATSVWTTASTCAVTGAGIGACIGGPVGAIIGGVVGFIVGMFAGASWGKISDAEVIDDCIRNLYNEIKEKENGTVL